MFDVPKTHPIPGVDGMQVSAWGEHYPLSQRSSLPVPIAQELVARFGKYPQPDEVITPRTTAQER